MQRSQTLLFFFRNYDSAALEVETEKAGGQCGNASARPRYPLEIGEVVICLFLKQSS